MKFAEYPFVVIDLYGRERHPEYTNSEQFDEETYAGRRARVELMMKTYSYVENGIPPDNRIILIEHDYVELTKRTGSTATPVSAFMGAGPQFGMLIDTKGRMIQWKEWERPEQHDEVLSHIFGLEPGF
jgi:hypothetical protein